MKAARSALLGASVLMFATSTAANGGLFAPTVHVSPAVIIALTALPTDAIGAIAQERMTARQTEAN